MMLSFMLAGHTKFAPDRFFGLIKRTYRRTRVDTIECLARVVANSTTTGSNKSQLVRLSTGEIAVKFHNWSTYLQQFFTSLPGITSYHIFHVDNTIPNTIFVREFSSSPEKTMVVGRRSVSTDINTSLPDQILPIGLDLERQWYLYDKIRPFCSSNLSADLTCPKPLFPKESVSAAGPSHSTESPSTQQPHSVEVTRKRSCTVCKGHGHNKRSCPMNNRT